MNSPIQTILAGTRSGIGAAAAHFDKKGLWAKPLAVGCGFHSPLVASVQERLNAEFFSTIRYLPPETAVFSNTTAAPYPRESAGIFAVLGKHFIRPVRFVEEIEAMYEAGARIFLECGPRHILTNRTREILKNRPHLALAADNPDESGLVHLAHSLGQLFAHGVPVQLDRLYTGRNVQRLSLDAPRGERADSAASSSTWLVNGGYARPWGAEKESPLKALSRVAIGELEPKGHVSSGGTGDRRPEPGAGGAGQIGAFQASMTDMMDRFFERQQEIMQRCLGGEARDEKE
jgi:acyl transferase domain-containing protein